MTVRDTPETCPSCGSTDTFRDSVDIGVGIQYGPLHCNKCGYTEDDEDDTLDLDDEGEDLL